MWRGVLPHTPERSTLMATELSATVSSKGQVVIPADVRRRLGLVQGSVVRFCMDDEGVRLIPAVGVVRRLKGRVPGPPHPVTLDDMRQSIVERRARAGAR